MKKILFVAKNLEIGGLEKSLVNLLNYLSNDYNITLILEEKKGILQNQLNPKICIQEYKVSTLKFSILRKTINFIKRIHWAFKNKNKYFFSCSYATYSKIGSRLALIASKNSALYVHSDYYEYYKGNKKEILSFFKDLKYYKFKNLIFVSNESMQKLKKILINNNNLKFSVINNLILKNEVLLKSNEKVDLRIFNKENINILFVGRLDNTSKNFDLLLDSFKQIKDDNYKLFIIGDGMYKETLIENIEKLNIKNKVFLLGKKENPYPYIKKCDALILTSKYEGFPVIYLEALILNKKVITTIPVSDDNIDIKKYFNCVIPNSKSISNEIKKIKNGKISYDVDFDKINVINYQKIVNMIEGD